MLNTPSSSDQKDTTEAQRSVPGSTNKDGCPNPNSELPKQPASEPRSKGQGSSSLSAALIAASSDPRAPCHVVTAAAVSPPPPAAAGPPPGGPGQRGSSHGRSSGGGRGGGGGGGPTSANHLLNFQPYSGAGRGANGGQRLGSGRRTTGGPLGSRSGRGQRPPKYDRDQFLQANFRFLVSDAVDSELFCGDPDRMFEWDDIVQVEVAVIAGAGGLQCPISLDCPPICPQITPCGHVFSFPSIMQHLINHGGNNLRCSAPCPLCFSPVVARELRLVRARPVAAAPKVGDVLSFQLLRRSRESILPEPAAGTAAAAAVTVAAAPAAAVVVATAGSSGDRMPAVASVPAAALSPATAAPHGLALSASKPGWSTPSTGTTGIGVADTSTAAAAGDATILRSASEGLLANIFAKFAVVGDATALWRESAQELAAYAAQVTSEGGLEAAYLAPYIYASLDALAARARRWTLRHAEAVVAGRALVPGRSGGIITGGGAPGCSDGGEAVRMASAAEAVVRQVFTAAVGKEEEGRSSLMQEAELEQDFPSLAAVAKAAAPPFKPSPARALPAPSVAAASSTAGGEPAATFLDGEVDTPALGAIPSVIHGPLPSRSGAVDIPLTATTTADAVALGSSPPPPASSLSQVLSGGAGGGPPPDLTGTSPTTAMLNDASSNVRGEYFMYQASDGTWVFLHPTSLRCLLHHFKTFEACPALLRLPILELEDVVQSDTTRRRWRFLAHLPAAATFKFAEVALTGLIPPESLVPFAEELAQRERRRRKRAAGERREAAREAAEVRAAEDARRGPSIQELRAMPALVPSTTTAAAAAAAAPAGAASSDGGGGGGGGAGGAFLVDDPDMQRAIEASLIMTEPGGPSASPTGNVGWARLVKMGYAATGPTLGVPPPTAMATSSSSASAAAFTAAASAQPPAGACWGKKKGSIARAAAGPTPTPASASGPVTWGVPPLRSGPAAAGVGADGRAAAVAEAPKAGSTKAKKGTLLFTTSQRKY